MKDEELAQLHRALSVPIRLKILKLISERPLCVKAITHSLTITQPAVSQHLAVLRRAGLVTGRKEGYEVHYAVNRRTLDRLRSAMARFPEEGVSGRVRAPAGKADG